MFLNSQQREIIRRCQTSCTWFLENFGTVKHASAGTLPFKPFDYQREAIKSFRKHRFNVFKKCRQCFAGSTMVWGPNGKKRIDEIKPGDLVYSLRSNDHMLACFPVSKVHENGMRECVKVTTTTGHVSIATSDHYYFTTRGQKQAKDLTPDDTLVEVNNSPRTDDIQCNVLLGTIDRYNVALPGNVKSVEPAGFHRVYDISVPPHDNYVVDGVVVHNSGISKISGGFALWFGLMNPNKNVLIVSRTDDTAMEFLREQVSFLFDNLPEWMRDLWKPVKRNEHEFLFPHGTIIRSLTSHPDVLRSSSASLNIIDEAAFIRNMDMLWTAGWSTLQHGGSAIVISTTSGIGNWFWSTVTDAQAHLNQFNLIDINWWDMTWDIEYKDSMSGKVTRIAPTDGIVKCEGQYINNNEFGVIKLDTIKYGEYWSPWLESQYRALQNQGEAWRFEQEILARFVGSGNTVISKEALESVNRSKMPPMVRVSGMKEYVMASGDKESLSFDFAEPSEGLWVWEKPVVATPKRYKGNKLVEEGTESHTYVMGVDIATGRGRDFSAITVLNSTTHEQVAEMMVRCLPRELMKYVDMIGRWYNGALAVIELNNGGETPIGILKDNLLYPNLWRRKAINDKPRASNSAAVQRALKVGRYGFNTTTSTKPTLNKLLIDAVRDDDSSWVIKSERLYKQLCTYVRKRDRTGNDTMVTEAEDGAGNYDDLVISFALALVGAMDNLSVAPTVITPTTSNMVDNDLPPAVIDKSKLQYGVFIPYSDNDREDFEQAIATQLQQYSSELGASIINKPRPVVIKKK